MRNVPDWHLDKLSWKRGVGEHVLYCDKRLKWLAILTHGFPTDAQLKAIANCIVAGIKYLYII
jgi:hypothetical protein